MFKVPKKLQPYVDYEDGKLISVDLPDDLQTDFKELKSQFEKLNNDNPLTDY